MHKLDWTELQYVLAVADGGSLNAAARVMGVNHTTVLRRITALEKQLSLRLFERSPRGYVLTPGGEEMLEVARAIDERVTTLERRLLGRDLRLTGTVRLATADTLALTLLPRHLEAFLLQNPELTLELTTSNVLVNLTKRDADVCLRPAADPASNLVGRKLCTIAFALYASPNYLAKTPAKRELAAHAWLVPDESLSETTAGRWTTNELGRVGARVAFRADSLVALRDAATSGMGVAMLPCYLGDRSPALERVRAEPVPGVTTELWLLTHRDLRGMARVRALMDFLGGALADERDLIEGRRAGAAKQHDDRRAHARTRGRAGRRR
ncbi:transcriptional regulator, LysR family [Labilithrix luteola]|uniref:Transcriptional regulator, LysR family n=1 Tax=Labilithrix luteola TaxID=1391654 RepID=A0A0K1QCH4_9BACT|nr:LysR family transcriptional regulator [Labilithrix luteola]AKV03357.1 transcriptional regulator, LysR family [Labilithrix luteola]